MVDPTADTERIVRKPRMSDRHQTITARLPVVRMMAHTTTKVPSRPCRFIRRLLGIAPKTPKV